MELTKTPAFTWFGNHLKRGFSILAGIVLALVSGLVIANSLITHASKDGVSAVKSDLRTLVTGCKMFQLETGRFPHEANWAEELTTQTEDHMKHMEKIPHDPWGNDYNYRWIGRHQQDFPDIWSNGPDGIEGTVDDSRNWLTNEEMAEEGLI